MASADVTPDVGTLARIVGAEFRAMPGLRLTRAQAQRLWHMSPDACRQVLDLLVREGLLVQDATGRYTGARSG